MIIYDVYFMYFTKKKRLQKGTDVTQVYENDVTEYKLDSYWQVDLDSSSHWTLTNTCDFLHYSPFHLTHMA